MRLLSRLITVVLVAVLTLATAIPADAQKRKTKAKTPATTTSTTKLPNPAYDATHPCNQQDEKLSDFLDKWNKSESFRKDRSSKVRMGSYFEEQVNLSDYDSDWLAEGVPGWHTNAEWSDMFTNPNKKVKKRGAKELSGERKEWEKVTTDLAVFVEENWDNVGYAGGSMTQYIFQKIDGKWYLVGVMAAG